MIINVTNEQNKQSPLILTELTEHKKDHDIWRWKSRSWFGKGTKMNDNINMDSTVAWSMNVRS